MKKFIRSRVIIRNICKKEVYTEMYLLLGTSVIKRLIRNRVIIRTSLIARFIRNRVIMRREHLKS